MYKKFKTLLLDFTIKPLSFDKKKNLKFFFLLTIYREFNINILVSKIKNYNKTINPIFNNLIIIDDRRLKFTINYYNLSEFRYFLYIVVKYIKTINYNTEIF